jgi:FdhE protein
MHVEIDTLETEIFEEKERIKQAFALARDSKPAYGGFYPFLECVFLMQAEIKQTLKLELPSISIQEVGMRWESGFPILHRWDFPVDTDAAEIFLSNLEHCIPTDNFQMMNAYRALLKGISNNVARKDEVWASFLHHEYEPWDEWMESEAVDQPALIFLARSCVRPSIEWTASRLLKQFPEPRKWLRGYCPVCGSMPAVLFLKGEGERRAFCSWCGAVWGLHRIQCPQCDNRDHEQLGYFFAEAEPFYRVQYCKACKTYFKLIDVRESAYPPFLPLEEWTTMHLDLLAQRAGWKLPASPSSVVYGQDG